MPPKKRVPSTEISAAGKKRNIRHREGLQEAWRDAEYETYLGSDGGFHKAATAKRMAVNLSQPPNVIRHTIAALQEDLGKFAAGTKHARQIQAEIQQLQAKLPEAEAKAVEEAHAAAFAPEEAGCPCPSEFPKCHRKSDAELGIVGVGKADGWCYEREDPANPGKWEEKWSMQCGAKWGKNCGRDHGAGGGRGRSQKKKRLRKSRKRKSRKQKSRRRKSRRK